MAFTCLHGCGKEFPFPLFPIIPCIIFSFILLFWILPSCILLCGVHSNKSSLFVPWILCWMLQSFTIILLPVALCLQGIVWRDYQRIKRDEKEKLSRYIRYKFLEITFSSLSLYYYMVHFFVGRSNPDGLPSQGEIRREEGGAVS